VLWLVDALSVWTREDEGYDLVVFMLFLLKLTIGAGHVPQNSVGYDQQHIITSCSGED
jgi:hypothetical protein